METTAIVMGKAVIKIMPRNSGWISLEETLQPQYLITQPRRELSWRREDFTETSTYQPPDGWSLIDAVTHASAEISAVIIKADAKQNYLLEIKMLRFKVNGSIVEQQIFPITLPDPHIFYFPVSLDRIKLVAYGEDVYSAIRWGQNEIVACRFKFLNNQFQANWQQIVEPPSFIETAGIIGGGFDNFHQGNRFLFTHAGVDSQGNFYVAVGSGEDLLPAHDKWFNEHLFSDADPGSFDFGVAILTKFSSSGERQYAKLCGKSRSKQFLNLKVFNQSIFLVGRIKIGTDPGSWDAWILNVDGSNGSVVYESSLNIKDGDMFWDMCVLPDGTALAVGTTNYTQNPFGLSVSDERKAAAFVLNAQGKIVKEIILPQGPSQRGNEAIFVTALQNGFALFSGMQNAPGTHADVYANGFITVKNISKL